MKKDKFGYTQFLHKKQFTPNKNMWKLKNGAATCCQTSSMIFALYLFMKKINRWQLELGSWSLNDQGKFLVCDNSRLPYG